MGKNEQRGGAGQWAQLTVESAWLLVRVLGFWWGVTQFHCLGHRADEAQENQGASKIHVGILGALLRSRELTLKPRGGLQGGPASSCPRNNLWNKLERRCALTLVSSVLPPYATGKRPWWQNGLAKCHQPPLSQRKPRLRRPLCGALFWIFSTTAGHAKNKNKI